MTLSITKLWQKLANATIISLFCCDNKSKKFLHKMHYHIILVKTHK